MTHDSPRPVRRQFVRFAFLKIDPAWLRLSPAQRAADMADFTAAVESFQGRMLLRSYSLVGYRVDAEILLWQVAENLDVIREFATTINQTALGAYLQSPHAFLSLTRRSIYTIPDEPADGGPDRITIAPGPSKYLFVYPFVKTRPWYALGKADRQRMMDEHIRVGRKYPQVKINTTYSYGLDDQEFVVAFETDDAPAFLDLVAELRETEASMYTLRDTPMFTCESIPLREILHSIGGSGIAVPARNGQHANGHHSDPQLHTIAAANTHGQSAHPTASTLASTWTKVAAVADLPPGTSKLVYAGGEAIALWNVDGQIFAINNRCTHARGTLCDGTIAGTTIVCPYHGGTFDLHTGAPLAGPVRIPVATYAVRTTPEGAIEVNPSESGAGTVAASTQPTQASVAAEQPAEVTSAAAADLDTIDKKLLNLLQWNFPLVEKPFQALAEQINAELAQDTNTPAPSAPTLTEAEVMQRVERLRQQTIIRQLSAIFDTRKIGYQSTLVAARVAPDHLDEAALIINEHPGVSHNYRRDNAFNLWFTLAVPPEEDLDAVLAALTERAGVEKVRKLPNLKMYKIAVKLDMEKDEKSITRKDDAPHYEKNPRPLTARDRVMIRAIQEDLPTTSDFFAGAAAEAGVTVPELFAWMREMEGFGYLRRFAGILRHQEAGFTANGMITWKVPEEIVDEVGFKAAGYPQVSHCYRRPIYDDWQYNVFSMVHARSHESCEAIAQRMAADIGIDDYIILYSTHEYKKTRVEYFSEDWDAWNLKDSTGAAWTDLDQRISAGEFQSGPTTWRERLALKQAALVD